MTTKACTTCKEEKGLEKFAKQKRGKYGVTSRCKCCSNLANRKRHADNLEKEHIRNKKYRDNNKEKEHIRNRIKREKYRETTRAKARVKYAENRESELIRRKEYRSRNKDNINTKARKWYSENKEKEAKRKSNHCKNNPEIYAARTARRRAAKLQRTPKWANFSLIKEIYKKAKELNLTVDHVIPLQGKLVSGLHVETNLQLLTASENDSKGNKFWI